MKALIKKDIFTLLKQMKVYILVLVVFSCLPGYSVTAFAIIYAAMLPITAMAYDERCKWPSMAVMMPYSPKDMVLSKYVIGYGAMIIVTFCSIISAFVMGMVRGEIAASESVFGNLGIMVIGCLLLAFLMPLMFRFGVEKGRIMMIIIIGSFTGIVYAIIKQFKTVNFSIPVSIEMIVIGSIVITVILTIISIYLSQHWYVQTNYRS